MLSILTEPTYPKAAIGIERETVTAVSLRKEGKGQFGVKRAATVELPSGLITPSFVEQNISSPEQFKVLLQETVVSAGLAGQKSWSVSLPSNSARAAILSLDKDNAGKGDAEEILEWKAEQSFGAPSGEIRITRTKISDDRQGRSRYFATAVKLSVINEYETIFEDLGWKAGLILPRAVSETQWLAGESDDSLLISSQNDGFTALLLRGSEAAVVRSVTCRPQERDDEIYRLLMFYHDRFADTEAGNFLERLLLIGKDLVPAKIREISSEALGRAVTILRPEDIGLFLPASDLRFDDIAAPAGLAALGWR